MGDLGTTLAGCIGAGCSTSRGSEGVQGRASADETGEDAPQNALLDALESRFEARATEPAAFTAHDQLARQQTSSGLPDIENFDLGASSASPAMQTSVGVRNTQALQRSTESELKKLFASIYDVSAIIKEFLSRVCKLTIPTIREKFVEAERLLKNGAVRKVIASYAKVVYTTQLSQADQAFLAVTVKTNLNLICNDTNGGSKGLLVRAFVGVYRQDLPNNAKAFSTSVSTKGRVDEGFSFGENPPSTLVHYLVVALLLYAVPLLIPASSGDAGMEINPVVTTQDRDFLIWIQTMLKAAAKVPRRKAAFQKKYNTYEMGDVAARVAEAIIDESDSRCETIRMNLRNPGCGSDTNTGTHALRAMDKTSVYGKIAESADHQKDDTVDSDCDNEDVGYGAYGGDYSDAAEIGVVEKGRTLRETLARRCNLHVDAVLYLKLLAENDGGILHNILSTSTRGRTRGDLQESRMRGPARPASQSQDSDDEDMHSMNSSDEAISDSDNSNAKVRATRSSKARKSGSSSNAASSGTDSTRDVFKNEEVKRQKLKLEAQETSLTQLRTNLMLQHADDDAVESANTTLHGSDSFIIHVGSFVEAHSKLLELLRRCKRIWIDEMLLVVKNGAYPESSQLRNRVVMKAKLISDTNIGLAAKVHEGNGNDCARATRNDIRS
ncbi:Hypothetical Protein FCC1311_005202 [Hondaea fermentalgiana]|uniref:Uncharacterized protein n=1 Tax=Hondaea fermentalgiana TaxID=2315210 RepID=A0A2R5FZW2_9STRA|nr:Hypothetical Protein FCC1311_005202 [Hondaea fermentalgiana]|eukprot:GBG24302.1 Hypothetical Protein FCC1311_005202 [Hondaea fermentalgiana]